MRRITLLLSSFLIAAVLHSTPGFSAMPAKAADLNEVLAILRTNVPAGMTEAELNSAAVGGLLSGLAPKAYIVEAGSEEDAQKKPISKTELFDSSIAYLRVEEVAEELPEAAAEALKAISKTNKVQGVVLDLRFASGEDYAAATGVADLFIAKAQPLLDWGQGMKNSTANTAISMPVALLVNEQTSGSAEALAAVLRDAGAGLIFGSATAGRTGIPRDFTLSNGQVLRIATQPLELGSGAKLSGKIKPDIEIQVSAEDERIYFADAFAVVTKSNQAGEGAIGTNRVTRRTRFSEADLVREHNLRSKGEGAPAAERPSDAPVVSDPVLARAIDVLKGLAVVRAAKAGQ